jgi:hypothetical protein
MAKRGRPASAAPLWECHIHLRLRVGEDNDIIEFFRALPRRRRAFALKSALRAGGMGIGQLADSDPDEELISAAASFLD